MGKEDDLEVLLLADALKKHANTTDNSFKGLLRVLHGETGANGLAGNLRSVTERVTAIDSKNGHLDRLYNRTKANADDIGKMKVHAANERARMAWQILLAILTVAASAIAAHWAS